MTVKLVFVGGLLLLGALVVTASGQDGRSNAASKYPTLPYKLVEWPAPPTSAAGAPGAWNFIQVASVAITPRGTILVLHRGAHPLMEFEPSGRFVRSWGEGMFSEGKVEAIPEAHWTADKSHYSAVYGAAGCTSCGAHSVRVDPQGNIWVIDAPGHVILSRSIQLLEVPTSPVDRSMGDVHPFGNPHFSMDPANGKIIAARLAETFSQLDPANAAYFQANLKKFNERLDKKFAEWTKLLEPYHGTKVVTYHKSFSYFLERFGLVLAGTIEPKPGVEPSPSYVNALIPRLKSEGVKLVMIEPFRPRKTPEYVAQAIGAKLLLLPGSVGGNEQAKDYFSLFDYDVSQVAAALKASK